MTLKITSLLSKLTWLMPVSVHSSAQSPLSDLLPSFQSCHASDVPIEGFHCEWLAPLLLQTQNNLKILSFCCLGALLVSAYFLRENQTCTELRSTISRHLLPPISRWGKAVDSFRRSCRKSRTSHRRGGVSGTGKGLPFGKRGRRRHKMVTTIWRMFDSP